MALDELLRQVTSLGAEVSIIEKAKQAVERLQTCKEFKLSRELGFNLLENTIFSNDLPVKQNAFLKKTLRSNPDKMEQHFGHSWERDYVKEVHVMASQYRQLLDEENKTNLAIWKDDDQGGGYAPQMSW
jgi:hypothetical protein